MSDQENSELSEEKIKAINSNIQISIDKIDRKIQLSEWREKFFISSFVCDKIFTYFNEVEA